MSSDQKITVVVVDDNDVSRRMLCHIVASDERYIVVGEAQGGIVGRQLTELLQPNVVCLDINMPDVNGIALLATAVPMKVAPALLDAARDDESGAMAKINVWSHSKEAATSAAADVNLRTMQAQKPGVLHNDFAACNDYTTGIASAAAVRCPALLIGGERDVMTPPKAASELAATLGSSRIIIPGAGHNLMGEAPVAVTDALVNFVTDHCKATT